MGFPPDFKQFLLLLLVCLESCKAGVIKNNHWCQNYYELLKGAQQRELQIIPHSENEHVLCYCCSNYLKIPNT